jgi:hypothetical protein
MNRRAGLGLLFLSGLLLTTEVRGQNVRSSRHATPSALSYGLTTNTNSGVFGGVVVRHERQRRLDARERPINRYLSAEIVNVRHPQEFRQQLPNGSHIRAGKQNYLFALRGQYGISRVLVGRGETEGIPISLILAGGPTIGLLKPYYIQTTNALPPNPPPAQRRIVNEPYDPLGRHSDPQIVFGPGNLLAGWGQTKIRPGAHLKAGLGIELSNGSSAQLFGVEAGALLEAYPGNILIVPAAGSSHVFSSAYLSVYFGHRR